MSFSTRSIQKVIMKNINSESSVEKNFSIDQRLANINKRILKNEFIPCLAELAKLSLEDLKNAKIWMLIGFAYTRMGVWSHAISALETAIKLKPGFTNAEHLLSLALFSMGRRREACALADKVAIKESSSANWMLRAYIHSHSSSDPQISLQVARDWATRFADPLTRKAKPIFVNNKNKNKRLKIGYVTADFREHSVAFFMKPILENHSHEDFEVFVFSNGPEDNISEYFKTLVKEWSNIMDFSDEEVCNIIRSLEIDILVDLSGFTHGHRLGVFARRSAPVQATYVGYLPTLGMKAMDYRLVDDSIAPKEHQKFYSEKLFQLRNVAAYSPPDYAPLFESLPMLRNGYPTLVSLNSSAKITDEILHVWSQILNIRKDARLLIMVKEADGDAARDDMLPRLKAANFDLERVSVMHQQPLTRFMEMGHIADLMLDTYPISAGTTALHASWMGLKIVTMGSDRAVEASGAATLRALGVDLDSIASDEDDYIRIAIDLMEKPEELLNHRLSVRDKMRASPTMNYKERTKDLEAAYRIMWGNFINPHAIKLGLNSTN